jgi:DNA-binding LacI/PurR family transcriptional regulator
MTTQISAIAFRSLSSVSYKNYEIGEKAAELLWGILNEKPLLDFEYYLFQPGIVERESCKGPRLRI